MRPRVGTRDALRVEPIRGPQGPGVRGPPGRWGAPWVLGKARGPVVTGMGVGGVDWGGLRLGSEPWQRAAEQGGRSGQGALLWWSLPSSASQRCCSVLLRYPGSRVCPSPGTRPCPSPGGPRRRAELQGRARLLSGWQGPCGPSEGFPRCSAVKCPHAMQETQVRSLSWEDPL